MYTQADIRDVQSQKYRRVIAWLVPEAMLAGLVIFSFARRAQWLTYLSFALLGFLVLFSLSLYILPVAHYQAHVERAVMGLRRQSVLAFKSVDEQPVLREGVAFKPLLFTAGHPQNTMDDRQLYWDANLPLPSWQPGVKLIVHSHEKAITGYAPAGPDEALSG